MATDTVESIFPTGESKGYLVVHRMPNAHEIHRSYDLLPGDLLQLDEDGGYTKIFPGLAIMGFQLSDEQEALLKPVAYRVRGLSYSILEDEEEVEVTN